jgi:hypothetical protein
MPRDAGHAGPKAGLKHGIRAAIGAAVLMAALVPADSAFASRHAISGSGPRAGWAPVPYQNAQLSVPGSWLVESPQQLSCGFSPPAGMIFVGVRPQLPKGLGCVPPASLAWIVPAGRVPPGTGQGKPTAVIHGIPVYRLTSGKGSVLYLVPDLGVRVGARGPQARLVLATLTRSPLSVVLRSGPAGPVPAGWTWRSFGGVRFAAPRSWRVQRADQWATCGTGLVPGALLLIDATRPPLALPCPLVPPTAAADQARAGLTAVTGRYAAVSVAQNYLSCRVQHGARICLSTVTGQGGFFSGVLIFSVSRENRPATAFFLLGLSGSGARARVIFRSISLAPQ